jgi:hypothetical protein
MPPFPVGTTEVYCYASDHAQNQSEQVLFLTAVITDTTAPVITLTGGASVSVEQGSTFVDPGYAVTDNSDVEMTVTIEGTVDTAVLGDYVLTYATSDDFGNTASTTRTVSVIEASAPSGGGGGGGGSRRADRNEEPPVEEEEVAETEEAVEGEVLGATTYNFSRSLRQGDSGADVMELQNFLRAQGHFTHVSTGYYGPITAAAVKAYQAAHGLPPVGLVGPSTLALLNQGTVTTDPHAALLLEIARLKAAIAELTAVQ